MGINEIEISSSGRATCIGCRNKIGKGTPRGVITIPNQNYGSSNSYVCYKCALYFIGNEIQHQKRLKKELNKLIKKKAKEIIVMGLEDGERKRNCL